MSKKLIAGAGVVASLAVALAPLATFATRSEDVSDQHNDELVVTVLPSCTFGSAAKTATEGAYFPGGVTHDDHTGGYAADADTGRTATSWHETDGAAGDEASGSITNSDEGGHLDDDKASTGYGILVGESGTTAANANLSEHTVHRSMLAGTHTATFAQTTMYVVCNNGDGYTVTATAADLTNGTETIPVAATIDATHVASGYNGIVSGTATRIADITVATTETEIAKNTGVSAEAGDTVIVTYGMGIKTSQKADTYAGQVQYKLYKGVTSGS